MLKSKLALGLSLSLLLNVSTLSIAYAGMDGEDASNGRALKKAKTKKENLREKKDLIRAYNRSLPESAQKWGASSRDVWSIVGNFLPLEDFIRLFSTNSHFLALGEELIQQRPFPKKAGGSQAAVIAVPFKLEVKFNKRKYTLSHLMRLDLSRRYFFDLSYCHLDRDGEIIEESFYSHRAQYYESIHPLMASYCSVQRARLSSFYTFEDSINAKREFNGQLREYTRRFDTLALEMNLYSKISNSITFKDDFLAMCFPANLHEDGEYAQQWSEVIVQLFKKTDDPSYIMNLACFLNAQEDRDYAIDRQESIIFDCIAWPLLTLQSVPPYKTFHINRIDDDNHPPVSVVLSGIITEEDALGYFNNAKDFKAKLAVLKYLASSDCRFCPSMAVLEVLVRMFEIRFKKQPHALYPSFHPAHLKEIEEYLHRLLSFSDRSNEFKNYVDSKFGYMHGEREDAIAQDDSVRGVDYYKNFALEKLLQLYYQLNDNNKMQTVIDQLTLDGTGESLNHIGEFFKDKGNFSKAITYYEKALWKGHINSVRNLWQATARKFGVNKKIITSELRKQPLSLFMSLSRLYENRNELSNAIRCLVMGSAFDPSGNMEIHAALLCLQLNDEERFNSFLIAAANKNQKDAVELINNARANGVTSFQLAIPGWSREAWGLK